MTDEEDSRCLVVLEARVFARDRTNDLVAEAGVTGVLKTCLRRLGDVGDTIEEEEDDETTVEETIDLPTYDFSFAIMPGYS